jgi:hypothetical protein
VRAPQASRRWTAVVTVAGYGPMAGSFSEHDRHDDQIMHAAHEALRLMRGSGATFGVIDLFENTEEHGNQRVEQRTVQVDQRGIVVSANLLG